MKKEEQQEDFLEMLHQCEGIIFRVCYLFTDRTQESVSDLYQEIVYNLWMSFPDFRGRSSQSTWVYRIAINTVGQLHRRRKRAPMFVQFDPVAFEDYADESHDSLVNRLYQLLDQLSFNQKSLIFLYLDGVPIKQMAALQKCSKATIMRRLHDIKQLLIQLNEKYE